MICAFKPGKMYKYKHYAHFMVITSQWSENNESFHVKEMYVDPITKKLYIHDAIWHKSYLYDMIEL